MTPWKTETFNVHFQLPKDLDPKDETALKAFARECISEWFKHLAVAGGVTTKETQPAAGLVEMTPGYEDENGEPVQPRPGDSRFEPVHFVAVHGLALMPPENPR